MSVALKHGDLLELTVDAIVNPANTSLAHVGGLAAEISERGGPRIQLESDQIDGCPLGGAVVTTAGDLKAKHVIHVPTVGGPQHRATLEDIENGTRAALQKAADLGLKSIAFPLLATGIAGLPIKPVALVMLSVFEEFPDLSVTLCVHWQGDLATVQDAYQQIVRPELRREAS